MPCFTVKGALPFRAAVEAVNPNGLFHSEDYVAPLSFSGHRVPAPEVLSMWGINAQTDYEVHDNGRIEITHVAAAPSFASPLRSLGSAPMDLSPLSSDDDTQPLLLPQHRTRAMTRRPINPLRRLSSAASSDCSLSRARRDWPMCPSSSASSASSLSSPISGAQKPGSSMTQPARTLLFRKFPLSVSTNVPQAVTKRPPIPDRVATLNARAHRSLMPSPCEVRAIEIADAAAASAAASLDAQDLARSANRPTLDVALAPRLVQSIHHPAGLSPSAGPIPGAWSEGTFGSADITDEQFTVIQAPISPMPEEDDYEHDKSEYLGVSYGATIHPPHPYQHSKSRVTIPTAVRQRIWPSILTRRGWMVQED